MMHSRIAMLLLWLLFLIMCTAPFMSLAQQEGGDQQLWPKKNDNNLPVSYLDVCQQAANSSGPLLFTVVASESESAGGTVPITTTRVVQLVNCTVPRDVDITIAIPPNGTAADGGVLIEIRNTTMQGGSLKIVPSTSDDDGSLPLQDVTIVVDDVVLECTSDVLLVDSASRNVQNISMTVQNARITSQRGNVASILIADKMAPGIVSHTKIAVRGNTTLQTQGSVIGSIVAKSIVKSTIILDTSSCLGPFVARTTSTQQYDVRVGVVSFFALDTTLHLEDSSILVTDDSSRAGVSHHGLRSSACPSNASIDIDATTHTGAACIAGICARHVTNAELFMTGCVSVDLHLSASSRPPSVNGTPTTRHRLVATGSDATAVAVGGVSMVVYSGSFPYTTSKIVVILKNCTFRTSLATQMEVEGVEVLESIVLMAIGDKGRSGGNAATVSGIAINSHSNSKATQAAFSLTNASSLSILHRGVGTSTSKGSASTEVIAVVASYGVSSVLGVAVISTCAHMAPTSTLVISNSSRILIASNTNNASPSASAKAANHPIDNRMSLVSKGHRFAAAAAVGIAVTTFSDHPSHNTFRVDDHSSSVSISCTASGTVGIVAGCQDYGAVSALGIAVSAATLGISAKQSVATTIVKGQVNIRAQLADGALAHVRATATPSSNENALSVLGISVYGDKVATLDVASVSKAPQFDVFVGAINGSIVSATGATAGGIVDNAVAAVGIVANAAPLGLDNRSKTRLTFCGTVMPIAVGGVAVGVHPPPTATSNVTIDEWNATHQDNVVCTDGTQEVRQAVRFAAAPTRDTNSCPAPPWYVVAVPTATSTASVVLSATETASQLVNTTSTTPTLTPTIAPPRTSSTFSQSVPPPKTPVSPTPPPKRRRAVVTSIMLVDNEEAATVVLSTGGASGAISSTLGSGGGGVVVAAGSAVRMMECGLASSDPRPASFELPIQFAVGDGTMRYFAGAALGHTLLQCFLFGLPMLLRRYTNGGRVVTYMSMMFCGSHAFFTPAILGACATVLYNDDDGSGLAVTSLCAFVILAVHMLVVAAVHMGPTNGIVTIATTEDGGGWRYKLEFTVRASSVTTTSSSSSTTSSSDTSSSEDDEDSQDSSSESSSPSTRSNGTQSTSSSAMLFSGPATKAVLLTLFDGCRVYEKTAHRHYSSIEISLFSVITIISGARPSDNCNYAAFAVGFLALTHFMYIVAVRPFRTALDTFFSLVNTVLVVVLSITVATVLQSNENNTTGEAPSVAALQTMEACLWLTSVMGFVQLGVQGYWAYHVAQRRLHRQRQELGNGDDSSVELVAHAGRPLLTVATTGDSGCINEDQSVVDNPLQQQS